jgi:TonB family protein
MLTLQRASHLVAFALTTTLVSVVSAASADSQVVEPPRLWSLAVKVVNPEYPVAARRSRLHGQGVLVGDVNFDTGDVKSVRMEKSTGSTILDQAALTAFGQWKFKPRTIRKFRTPIDFTTTPRI